MIIDHFAEKQDQIDKLGVEMATSYPATWNRIIANWKSSNPEDRAWLMYSANYLFRIHGVRWALDPLELNCRLPKTPKMDVARDLNKLDFVLLTHRHGDHLNIPFIRALNHLPILWVVPEDLLPLVQKQAGLSEKQILVPEPLRPIELWNHHITPFNGLHWESAPGNQDGSRGVPAIGYLVETGSMRLLFPGDSRNYDPHLLPDFGSVDMLFAHLWLGRGMATQSNQPMIQDFCHFCLALKPRRILLTHLQEWGRRISDFWDVEHIESVAKYFRKLDPSIIIEPAIIGDSVQLK